MNKQSVNIYLQSKHAALSNHMDLKGMAKVLSVPHLGSMKRTASMVSSQARYSYTHTMRMFVTAQSGSS